MHHSQKSIENKTLFYAWFPAMHTRIDLMFFVDEARNNMIAIAEKIETEIKKLESLANRFDQDSELSIINQTAYGNSIQVSDEMFQIVTECLMYNDKTLGHFDITINSKNGLTEAISKIKLDPNQQSITFIHPDLQLDLSGFIKGYALRAVKQILFEEKIENALINIGNSSILALGNHPFGIGWKIAIPTENNSLECELFNQCLTTSGNTKNTKWPIQQPSTRETITQSELLSVITNDPAAGEVLSIALYISNVEEQHKILNQLEGKIINLN